MVVATFSYSIFDAEIDLTTRDGVKLYNSGSQALSTIFNGDTKDLLMFLNDLSSRSEQCKWESIVTFGTHNLLEDYGRITLNKLPMLETSARITSPPHMQKLAQKLTLA
jgi:hypothetical protein